MRGMGETWEGDARVVILDDVELARGRGCMSYLLFDGAIYL
jgi:hypothetical protein